jgi:hypothetical protein
VNPLKRGRATRLALAAFGAVGALAIFVGVASALNGQVTLSAGSLSVAPPSDFTIASTPLTGAVQYLSSGPVSFDVTDATGSGSGWSVDVAAGDFTCNSTSDPTNCSTSHTIGPFEVSGNSDHSQTTAPTAACAVTSPASCSGTVASSVASYPVTIANTGTTDAFDQTGSGNAMGSVAISNWYWWITVPVNAYVGVYKSVVTLSVQSGPGN